MEQLVIQADIANLTLVENFVRAICDDNHIVNYYATISVPVMKAVEHAILGGSSSQLTLLFSHCHDGITFSIQADTPSFSPIAAEQVPPAGSPEEALYLISMLSDQMEVSDEGRTLQMTFDLQGIDTNEACNRVEVLEQFYASVRTLVPQAAEL